MAGKQKRLLIVVAAVIFMMLLYPPHRSPIGEGTYIGAGYNWIFAHGLDSGIVNIGLLITQWVGVLIVGGICYLLLKER